MQPGLGRGTDPLKPPELGELRHPDLLLVVGSVLAGGVAQTGFSAWMIGPSEYPIRSYPGTPSRPLFRNTATTSL